MTSSKPQGLMILRDDTGSNIWSMIMVRMSIIPYNTYQYEPGLMFKSHSGKIRISMIELKNWMIPTKYLSIVLRITRKGVIMDIAGKCPKPWKSMAEKINHQYLMNSQASSMRRHTDVGIHQKSIHRQSSGNV